MRNELVTDSQAGANSTSNLISKLLDVFGVHVFDCNSCPVKVKGLQLLPHFIRDFTQSSCFSVHYGPCAAYIYIYMHPIKFIYYSIILVVYLNKCELITTVSTLLLL